jgi:hypothetical protein
MAEETFPDMASAAEAFVRLEFAPRLVPHLPLEVEVKPAGVSHARRLMCGDEVVGMALQLTNGRWTVNDTNDRPLTRRTFPSALKARDAFVELSQTAAPQEKA